MTKEQQKADAVIAMQYRIDEVAQFHERITELEAELSKHQWISVEDRLPEDTEHMRILNKSRQSTIGWYKSGKWRFVMCWDDQGFFFSGEASNITHWKPITLSVHITDPSKMDSEARKDGEK